MSINLMGVNAYRRTMTGPRAARITPKAKNTGKVDETKRDRLELQFTDLLQAEESGFFEVNGRRFTFSEDMAVQMRTAYDEMLAHNEKYMEYQAAADTAKAAEQRLKALEGLGDAMRKAMEIARRIAKGGHVPPEDEEFLLEYSQEMFISAKIEGMAAKEHEKYDSVLGDEDEKSADGEDEDGEDGGDSGRTRAIAEVTLSDGAVSGVSVGEVPVSSGSGE